MTNGTTLSVSPIHLALMHGENVFVDHFLQTHHIIKSHVHSSDLSALISNPSILARVENHPFLRAAILSNPFLAEEISYTPRLLNILIQNPSLITSILASPKLLTLIKQNPQIVSKIIRNPGLSIEEVLEKLSEIKPKLATRSENVQINKKPHKLENSTIAAEKVRSAMRNMASKINPEVSKPVETQKQQFSKYLVPGIFEGKPGAAKSSLVRFIPFLRNNIRELVMNPALLAQLGAIAVTTNKGRIVGNTEELETQTERQLDTLEEIAPIHEVEESSEVHLMKETVA